MFALVSMLNGAMQKKAAIVEVEQSVGEAEGSEEAVEEAPAAAVKSADGEIKKKKKKKQSMDADAMDVDESVPKTPARASTGVESEQENGGADDEMPDNGGTEKSGAFHLLSCD